MRRENAVHPITAVQLEWSLWTWDVEGACRELGNGIVPYSPLGRGFFSSGPKMVENLEPNDFRAGERGGCKKRLHFFRASIGMGSHHQRPDVCPIPGTPKIENLNQNIGALSVKLATRRDGGAGVMCKYCEGWKVPRWHGCHIFMDGTMKTLRSRFC